MFILEFTFIKDHLGGGTQFEQQFEICYQVESKKAKRITHASMLLLQNKSPSMFLVGGLSCGEC